MKNIIVLSIASIVLLLLSGCGNSNTSTGTNMDTEFLPVEKAFQFSSEILESGKVRLSWKIAEGYHLYKDKFEFQLSPDSARISNIEMPEGVIIDDKTFGRQETYKDQVTINLDVKSGADLDKVNLTTKYQGCSIKGLCYPPEKRDISIPL